MVNFTVDDDEDAEPIAVPVRKKKSGKKKKVHRSASIGTTGSRGIGVNIDSSKQHQNISGD